MALHAYICHYSNKDIELSRAWVKKALSSGNAFAVGYCHYYELAAKGDFEAFKFLKASSEEGNEYGLYMLGLCFANGYGSQVDKISAFVCFSRSAERGLAESQCKLGNCFRNGEGCRKNLVMSKMWFRKAAEQGQRKAKLELDEMESMESYALVFL